MAIKDNLIYDYLRQIKILKKIKSKIINFDAYKYKFHGDLILQKSFYLLCEEIGVTSIIETGTFLGGSASFFAKTFPNKSIYTCEIDPGNFRKAKKNLRNFDNVKVFNASSPKFLKEIISKKILGKKPLFFLDAHWLNNWPLEEEIKLISENIDSAIIIIDDFKIPGNENFAYDSYENRECSLEMVIPNLSKNKTYNLLFPNYEKKDAFERDIPHHDNLVGYPIIFQNISKFKEIYSGEFFKKYFIDRSKLINPCNQF